MNACARGCTIRRQHLAECDTADCGGCLPRSAETPAVVCWPDVQRVTQAVAAAPALVEHIRTHLEPGAAPERTDNRGAGQHGKGSAPPAPLNVAAAADADELHAALASWALLVIEERGVTGPDWSGSDVRPASKRRSVGGAVVYEDARVAGLRQVGATAVVAEWLHPHLPWALEQPWADALADELPRLVDSLTARWPVEERPVYLPTPCLKCERLTLRRYPPAGPGLDPSFRCSAPDCDEVLDPDTYDLHARVILEREREAAKAAEGAAA